MRLLIKVLLNLLILTISTNITAQDGKVLYRQKTCYSCHGDKAYGNQSTGAPNLAGQAVPYLIRQLKNFKAEIRGFHQTDINGMSMQSIAVHLTDDEIDKLAYYLNSLQPEPQDYTLGGNPNDGKQYFMVCQSCHGSSGTGRPRFNTPNLQILNDWYILTQLKLFKTQKRGVDPVLDLNGATMAPNTFLLPDNTAMLDVIAYIYSLRYPKEKKN